ncbi:MAG: response regulator [Acidiferrobacterales bacterium]
MDPRKYLISAFGFSESERHALKSIFNLATTRVFAYSLVNPEERITPDIALVDADDPQAVDAWRRECQAHNKPAPAVMVADTASSDAADIYISRPLTMKKVLDALDDVRIHAKTQAPESADAERAVTDVYEALASNCEPAKFSALVVDDSLSVRKFMEDKLGEFGVSIDLDFAASGEQAVALADERQYDIIFLDVTLPGIDGYRVCKSIRGGKRSGNSPIIMLTSNRSPFDRVKSSMAGCQAYLTKPPDAKRLDAIILKYLFKGRTPRERSGPQAGANVRGLRSRV